MGSPRRYWSIAELLQDYRYFREHRYEPAREKARASWVFLLKKWNIADADQAAMDVVEGYRPRPYKGPY